MANKQKKQYEADVVAAIFDVLKKNSGIKAFKTHGNSFSVIGMPDIVGCVWGRQFVIEVKLAPNKPTDAQINQLDEWAAAGAIAVWVDDTVPLAQLYSFVEVAHLFNWTAPNVQEWMKLFNDYREAYLSVQSDQLVETPEGSGSLPTE